MSLPWLPEEEIHPVYLRLELPIAELLDCEKKLVKAFRTMLVGHGYVEIITYRC